jgi:hypothetical protein
MRVCAGHCPATSYRRIIALARKNATFSPDRLPKTRRGQEQHENQEADDGDELLSFAHFASFTTPIFSNSTRSSMSLRLTAISPI